MSKKVDAITNMVFFAKENPRKLAEVIAGLVTDTATSISLAGADSITVPAEESVTEDYTATVVSQFGDEMTGSVTLSLKEEVTGVSISSNTVTVNSTATAGSFVIKAVCGSVTAEKTVALVKSE